MVQKLYIVQMTASKNKVTVTQLKTD